MVWSKKLLGEISIIRPPKSEARMRLEPADLVSFVPMTDLGERSKYFTSRHEKPLCEVQGSYTYFADNDILLAKITPCFENGKLGIARNLTNGIGFGSSEYFVIRPSDELDAEFLYYYLSQEWFRSAGQSVMAGAVGHKRVPLEFLENHPLPLPPLPEQRRIVAILDEAFAGLETMKANAEKNLHKSTELFCNYKNSVFLANDGWRTLPLEQVSTIISGYSFKSTDFMKNLNVKCVKITNVGVGKFVDEFNDFLPEKFKSQYVSFSINTGDIIIALTRTIILDGVKVAMVPPHADGALLNQRVASIRVNEKIIDSNFLFSYLTTNYVYEYVRKNVNTLMQPNLSINDLRAMSVSFPQYEEQLQISHKLKNLQIEIDKVSNAYSRKISLLEELKQSILHKAFSGKLTSSDKAA